MKDFLDNPANVTLLFRIVKCPELDRALSGSDMCLEDGGLTLSLGLQNIESTIEATEKVKTKRKSICISIYSLCHL